MSDYPLWKRCRILANPLRLEILSLVARQERQFVRVIGEQLRCSEDIASKHLQYMATGGFLVSEREGRFLFYSIAGEDFLAENTVTEIRRTGSDIGSVMKCVTAYTHERRISIVKELARSALEGPVLGARTGISAEALNRHLDKLVRRGLVCKKDELWALNWPKEQYARQLLEHAIG